MPTLIVTSDARDWPFDIPGVGRIAIITDPGQGVCGIMTPAPQD